MTALPPIPGSPFRALDTTAWEGLWEGSLHEVRWGYPKGWLRSQVRRALLRRRGFELTVHAGDAVLVVGIRDEGTTGGIHAALWQGGERRARASATGRPLSELAVGPFAAEGTDAWLRTAEAELVLSRREGESAWTLAARLEGLTLDLTADTANAPPAVTAIGEPRRRRPGLSTRWNLLNTRGQARLGEQVLDLEGLGAMAYTNTFLIPGSQWVDAVALGRLADGRRIGLGLAEGGRHGGVAEHVLYLDGPAGPGLHLLPPVELGHEPGGWRARSASGAVDLGFRATSSEDERVARPWHPMHIRREVGRFSGTLTLPDGTAHPVELPGVLSAHQPA